MGNDIETGSRYLPYLPYSIQMACSPIWTVWCAFADVLGRPKFVHFGLATVIKLSSVNFGTIKKY